MLESVRNLSVGRRPKHRIAGCVCGHKTVRQRGLLRMALGAMLCKLTGRDLDRVWRGVCGAEYEYMLFFYFYLI